MMRLARARGWIAATLAGGALLAAPAVAPAQSTDQAKPPAQAASAAPPAEAAQTEAPQGGPIFGEARPLTPDQRHAQDAAQPDTLFPPWRLQSTRAIDPRVGPNAGFRLPPLFPAFTPVTPDYRGSTEPAQPWAVRASLALFGVEDDRVSSKFQEFRDARDGVTAGVEAHYRQGDHLLNLVGRELGRRDQDLAMDGGYGGRYAYALTYEETPHNYAFGVPSLYGGVGTGDLTIADPIQADLQRLADPFALGARAQQYVDAAQKVDLSLRRQKVGAEFTLVQTYPFVIKGSFSNESRDGVRPWSGSFGFGNFEEIPWPVAYDTRELRISAEYAKPESRVSVNAGYRLSLFEDHIQSVTFDNPFRVTDTVGALIGSSSAGAAAGRISLYPSNDYHEGSVSTVVKKLPLDGVLSAFFSAGFMRQNEPLIPFSSNSADVLTTLDGRTFAATDPSGLPRGTAEAAMNTQAAQVRWTAQPAPKWRLVGQYRLYAMQNHMPTFAFPGFIREDADVRVPDTPGGIFQTVPADYNRHTASAEATYAFQPDTHLGVTYTFERMNRNLREVAWMNDNAVKVTFDKRAASWLDLRTSYTYTNRNTATYDYAQYDRVQGNVDDRPMLPFLLKFDEAPYHKQDAQVMATVTHGDVSLSGQALYGGTDYHDSPFGVLDDRHYLYSGDVTYLVGERLSLFADYSYERYRNHLKDRQWTPGGPSDPYLSETGLDSASNWENRSRDNVQTAGVGLEAYLVPRRIRLNVQYTYSRTDGRWAFSSPIGAVDVNAFDPAPVNQVDNVRWHTLNPELEFTLTERLALTAAYYFEKWDISDLNYPGFSSVTLTPFAGSQTISVLMGGILPPAYTNHVLYIRAKLGL